MKTIIHNYIILILLLTLGACATNTVQPTAWVNKETEITLPPPLTDHPLQAQQLLTTTYKDKSHSLMVLLDVQKNELNLVGLTPVGIRLFTINYNQHGIQSKYNLPIPNLPKANQVLLDIMLAYWPVNTWTEHLPENWHLEETENKRVLTNNQNEPVIEITYTTEQGSQTPKTILHHQFGYTINLDNMEETAP